MELLVDSVLRSDNLDEELKSSLAFDYIMNEYIILIERATETKYTSISLSEKEISKLIHKMTTLLRVGRKYLPKKFPGTLDVPIELHIPIDWRNFTRFSLLMVIHFNLKIKLSSTLQKSGKKKEFVFTNKVLES